jgi:hypothetical protein
MPLFIAVLLGLSGLAVVLYPLLGLEREASEATVVGPLTEVAERERSARDALREVEFDHRLGNLDDSDYQALRDRYERRALAALKSRYQREQELDTLIEQQLDTLRAQPSAADDDAAEPSASAQTPPARKGANEHGRAVASNSREGRNSQNGTRRANGPLARRRRGGRA